MQKHHFHFYAAKTPLFACKNTTFRVRSQRVSPWRLIVPTITFDITTRVACENITFRVKIRRQNTTFHSNAEKHHCSPAKTPLFACEYTTFRVRKQNFSRRITTRVTLQVERLDHHVRYRDPHRLRKRHFLRNISRKRHCSCQKKSATTSLFESGIDVLHVV